MKRLITALIVGVPLVAALVIVTALFLAGSWSSVRADPHPGQSVDVVIIGGTTLDLTCSGGNPSDANVANATGGGCLPVVGPAGELGDFTFTPMDPAAVSAASLALYDTAVLNVASSAMACNTNTLAPAQQADIIAFVGAGHKLIISDSECSPGGDYSWLPFPFTTSNPGPWGQPGTLTIVEDNLLSTLIGDPSCTSGDPHCIDAAHLGPNTDAVGDMNVMTTFDPNWCVDMSGTNYLGVTGPVHTYADYPSGTDAGLIIYNGLDMDYLYGSFNDPELRQIWVQELQHPFNPSLLPCLVPATDIDLLPVSDTNYFGEDHTVTANVFELTPGGPSPLPDILVSFEVTAGPNAGASGTCSVNADCTSDANGDVSWTYTDSAGVEACDTIVASFTDQAGNVIPSPTVEKCWEPVPNTPPEASCVESVNPSGKKVPPAGSTTLPGPKGGQNEDGFYELISVDAEDGTTDVFVSNESGSAVFGPFPSGAVVKITEAPDAVPSAKPMGGPNSAVAAHIKLNTDAVIFAVDSMGWVSQSVSCLVPPPPK